MQYALGMSGAVSVRLIKRLAKYSGFYLKNWLGCGDVKSLCIWLQKYESLVTKLHTESVFALEAKIASRTIVTFSAGARDYLSVVTLRPKQ